jgi:hypothetical protein
VGWWKEYSDSGDLGQAVSLTNGSVYFGRLQNYGSPHPVSSDVFYVVSQTDPETKQVKSALIKRGKEMHEPDRMFLNPNQIVFAETAGRNSLDPARISAADSSGNLSLISFGRLIPRAGELGNDTDLNV